MQTQQNLSHLPNMKIQLGSYSIVLSPDTELYKFFKKQLGLINTQGFFKFALKQDIMRFSYSSAYNGDHKWPLLDGITGTTAWCAQSNDVNQYVQLSSDIPQKIVAIETQGRFTNNQWVKKYKLSYSNDGSQYFGYGGHKQFIANSDRNSHVKNYLQTPIIAKYLRIHPTEWNQHISMRFDVLAE